jgi:serine phosphatase RsbU (regulator of sigma subunit)
MSKKAIIEELKKKINDDFTKDMALVLSILQKHGQAEFNMDRELIKKKMNQSSVFQEYESGQITVSFTLKKDL